MTRTDLNTATRAALVSYLKAANAYAGHSRDKVAELRTAVAAVMDAADAAAKAPADKAPADKARKVKDLKARKHADRLMAAPSAKTIAKLAAAVGSVAPDADGNVVLTAADVVKAGLGKHWATGLGAVLRDPRSMYSQAVAIVTEGGTAVCSRGTLTVTGPAAAKADTDAA
jgi:hypothetical protein